jgi:4-hydroxybenzoate polyprenyltransferase
VLVFTLGTIVMRARAARSTTGRIAGYDANVKRTASRPLADRRDRAVGGARGGRVSPAGGFLLVVLATNRATVLLSFAALAITIAYPFFKRFFALPAGVPRHRVLVRHPDGVRGGAGLRVAVRVVAHDHQPLLGGRLRHRVRDGRPRRRHQDRLRTSAITFGRYDVLAVGVCYGLYFVGMAWVGIRLSLGAPYWTGIAIAALIAIYHLWLIRTRDRMRCFRAFLHNHWLGFTMFAAVAADYAWRFKAWPRTV